jgi:hypothetical protein
MLGHEFPMTETAAATSPYEVGKCIELKFNNDYLGRNHVIS